MEKVKKIKIIENYFTQREHIPLRKSVKCLMTSKQGFL